ncbi:hypothetical protein Tco_0350963 [Tanacetum coccineum]
MKNCCKKKILEALEDESWVYAMQEELLQFKIQKVWILVDLPFGKKALEDLPCRFQKHLKMKVGLMLCKKNCCSSRYRKFRYLLICLLGRRHKTQVW